MKGYGEQFPYDPTIDVYALDLIDRLNFAGLMDKTPRQMSADEIRFLAQAFADTTHGFEMPFWEPEGHKRRLVIPRNAPMTCKYWLQKDESKALEGILKQLNATPEEKRAYLGEIK